MKDNNKWVSYEDSQDRDSWKGAKEYELLKQLASTRDLTPSELLILYTSFKDKVGEIVDIQIKRKGSRNGK